MLSKKELKELKENKSLSLGIIKGIEIKKVINQIKKELNITVSNKYVIDDNQYYQADIYHNNKFYKLFIH